MAVIIDYNDIKLTDFLGARIGLGEHFQAYRPRKSVKTLNASIEEIIVPAVWIFGRLELDLQKGLVLFVEKLYYPDGIDNSTEKEIVKVGWRLKVSSAKFSLLKCSELITDPEPFFKFAKGRGIVSLRKHKLTT